MMQAPVKCLLSEIADGANGRFVKMYESYDKWSAAQEGVFLKTMGRHSVAWMLANRREI